MLRTVRQGDGVCPGLKNEGGVRKGENQRVAGGKQRCFLGKRE